MILFLAALPRRADCGVSCPHTARLSTHSQRIHDSLPPIPSLGHPLLPVAHYKVCAVLCCPWISLAATSLAVGLWRSLTTSDEGKCFTDAAYVVAVGGLVIYPIQNRHASRCRITIPADWDPNDIRDQVDGAEP